MKLSIVTTLYCSAPYIDEFHKRISEIACKVTDDYEVIFVNDGSPDNSIDIALALYDSDPKVKVVDLSRNFGHHKAMMTGLAHAAGEYIFLIDVDLEENPELLENFWQEMHSTADVDVVFGKQASRKGNWFERISGDIFYRTFNWVSSTKVPVNLVTVRLMKRDYVNALLRFKEQELFLAGIWSITGFNQKPVVINKFSHSPTSYSFTRKIGIIINSITSFSNKPLMWIFYLGCIMMMVSIIYIGFLIYKRLYLGIGLVGWTSIIASIWLVGGIVMFSLGVVGIYLSKIFMEVKNRPYTIVKKNYSRS